MARSISQFELHLRAITDLPLPPPVVNSPSVMINLIGTDLNYDWLKLPLVHLALVTIKRCVRVVKSAT